MEQGKTFISKNLVKTSERIDINGNIIDPITKKVLVKKEEEYVPPPPPTTPPDAPQTPTPQPIAKDDGLSVLQQIEATKLKLAELEEARKVKIAETEKLLKELKQ